VLFCSNFYWLFQFHFWNQNYLNLEEIAEGEKTLPPFLYMSETVKKIMGRDGVVAIATHY
jgi:hypothetical protein